MVIGVLTFCGFFEGNNLYSELLFSVPSSIHRIMILWLLCRHQNFDLPIVYLPLTLYQMGVVVLS